jgi:hypothetical protein
VSASLTHSLTDEGLGEVKMTLQVRYLGSTEGLGEDIGNHIVGAAVVEHEFPLVERITKVMKLDIVMFHMSMVDHQLGADDGES